MRQMNRASSRYLAMSKPSLAKPHVLINNAGKGTPGLIGEVPVPGNWCCSLCSRLTFRNFDRLKKRGQFVFILNGVIVMERQADTGTRMTFTVLCRANTEYDSRATGSQGPIAVIYVMNWNEFRLGVRSMDGTIIAKRKAMGKARRLISILRRQCQDALGPVCYFTRMLLRVQTTYLL